MLNRTILSALTVVSCTIHLLYINHYYSGSCTDLLLFSTVIQWIIVFAELQYNIVILSWWHCFLSLSVSFCSILNIFSKSMPCEPGTVWWPNLIHYDISPRLEHNLHYWREILLLLACEIFFAVNTSLFPVVPCTLQTIVLFKMITMQWKVKAVKEISWFFYSL